MTHETPRVLSSLIHFLQQIMTKTEAPFPDVRLVLLRGLCNFLGQNRDNQP